MLPRRTLGITLAGAALLAGCANAQTGGAMAGGAAAGGPAELRASALQGGMFLMQSAELGIQKATRADVKRFAQFEAAEQQSIVQAMQIAGQPAMQMPLPAQKATMLQSLQAASGTEFDRMFVQAQTMGHQEALQVYSAIQNSSAAPTTDRVIATLAVTTIREHLVLLQLLG
ncbi:DUF4142 domain-containing protein [Roseomonas elaeocarpi]|uniref:DUF4142 domain-containing protein n=1 Tax=Roseomonas elaeocarpi TaxID=907779 RepID=A0ABV6JYS3_9PROT